MQRKILLSVAVALALGAPAATASWTVGGSLEPDTTYDTSGGLMHLNPDVSPNPNGGLVYFSAVQHEFTTPVNPNTGATGSGVRSAPHQTFAAYLGVWKDCNQDGYIGHFESVLAEYPSALLGPSSICPSGSPHNEGTWVYEFFPIGPGDIDASTGDGEADETYQPHHMVNDTASLVWGDRGAPGEQPRISCAINPVASGTTAGSGGVIAYFDCIAGRQITGATQSVDPDGGLGIALDSTPQNDDSLLNQRFPVHPYYDPWNDDTGALEDTTANGREKDHAFVAWDCSADSTPVADPTGGELPRHVEDPTGGELSDNGLLIENITDDEGNLFYVPAPASDPALNDQGSVYDGANQTFTMCDEDSSLGAGNAGVGIIEGGNGGVDTDVGRRETDVYFSFTYPSYAVLFLDHQSFDDNACVFTDVPVAGDVPPECRSIQPINGTIADDTPYWAGIGVHRTDAFAGGPIWYGLPNYVSPPQSVNRATLQPEGPTYWTFYAHVGTSVEGGYTLPANRGTYGSEFCRDGVAIAPGWDCNPSHWWNPQYDPAATAMPTQGTNSEDECDAGNGQTAPNCRNVGVRTGQAYQLRDVDCYDGQLVRGQPVYASLVYLAGTCDRPA